MLNLKKSGTVTLGTVSSSDIDDDVMRLAQQLSKKHGNAKIMMESGGVHIYNIILVFLHSMILFRINKSTR